MALLASGLTKATSVGCRHIEGESPGHNCDAEQTERNNKKYTKFHHGLGQLRSTDGIAVGSEPDGIGGLVIHHMAHRAAT